MSEETKAVQAESAEAEIRGFAHAVFAGHSLPVGHWNMPPWRPISEETNNGPCACGKDYDVSDQYHYHHGGKCHNRVECRDHG